MRSYTLYMAVVAIASIALQFNAVSSDNCYSSRVVSNKMRRYNVVPNVIPVAPTNKIEVIYTNGVNPVKAELGNELTPTQVKDIPFVNWRTDLGAFYTLCMIDIDAPSRTIPTRKSSLHWLVGNISGSKVNNDQTIIAEYVGSGPPLNSGLHRYVFLVYKQPSKLTFDEPRISNRSVQNRREFSIADFADKYKLGNPVAGNLYQAQYDDYVPILHRQLGV